MNLKDCPQQILKGEPKPAQMKTLPEPLQEILKKSTPLLNPEEVLQLEELLPYRSAVHESTGKTPASIVFGAELRLPIDLISDQPKKEEGVDNYISRLQDRLKLTHAEVRQKMRIESDRMKTRYDLRANTGGFQVGEKVWLYYPKRTKGKLCKCPGIDATESILDCSICSIEILRFLQVSRIPKNRFLLSLPGIIASSLPGQCIASTALLFSPLVPLLSSHVALLVHLSRLPSGPDVIKAGASTTCGVGNLTPMGKLKSSPCIIHVLANTLSQHWEIDVYKTHISLYRLMKCRNAQKLVAANK
ncbi:hypothetical protein NQ315_014275 [Exocentrus adspersus]|uniref:Uncharacterized protein n=1 Tax=Exocentrus adspersus TaxID=1586481 RepID=A0AAV8VIX5_9CUCU|nr:hypothetical protein NQ315_014275 [Exocentrus adspersus]